jgi:hypothetical protein
MTITPDHSAQSAQDEGVSPRTAATLRVAMDRLLAGWPASGTSILVHNDSCGAIYENPGHHDPTGGPNPYNPNKAVLPGDAEEQFANSVRVGNARWAKVGSGKRAVYYRYSPHEIGNNVWHFSGSTNGVTANGTPVPIALDKVPISIRRSGG